MFRQAIKITVCSVLAALFAVIPANAGTLLVYDASNGRVLYAEDADQPWYAASLTKMMTAYLVFEAYESGRAQPDTKITISKYAASRPRMRLGLGANKKISFDHALKALLIRSANDIAVAIAEALEKTEDAFVARMNATAHRLGMYATRFINPHGLPGEHQHTTARDMAILTEAISERFPQYLSMFAIESAQIGKRTYGNHNPLLRTYAGTDGMKTGFTCSAGYNIVASATREGQRIVAIVMGSVNGKARKILAKHLLEYGFSVAPWKKLVPGPTIWSLPETRYERPIIRERNLSKRYWGCLGPHPTYVLSLSDATVASLAPSVIADKTIEAVVTSARPKPPAKPKYKRKSRKKTVYRKKKKK